MLGKSQNAQADEINDILDRVRQLLPVVYTNLDASFIYNSNYESLSQRRQVPKIVGQTRNQHFELLQFFWF